MAVKVKMFKIPADYGVFPVREVFWVDLSQIDAVSITKIPVPGGVPVVFEYRLRLRSHTMENLHTPSQSEAQIIVEIFKDFATLPLAEAEALLWADRVEDAKK